ncbi:MAG TPA: GntR family transcriptional regulator [Symbiobacteriaceae bacterium]|nr:GntR family transcriptional regulator [Symbiobacteriaceae bacterium]
MWFHLDPSSGLPIYRQLVDQVKQAVVGGVLKPGDRLPSVRDLAVDLAINPHTVAKAYQELEREGVITVRRGKGAFIAELGEGALPPLHEREAILNAAIERLAAKAYRLQFHPDEVLQRVQERLARLKNSAARP